MNTIFEVLRKCGSATVNDFSRSDLKNMYLGMLKLNFNTIKALITADINSYEELHTRIKAISDCYDLTDQIRNIARLVHNLSDDALSVEEYTDYMKIDYTFFNTGIQEFFNLKTVAELVTRFHPELDILDVSDIDPETNPLFYFYELDKRLITIKAAKALDVDVMPIPGEL